MKSNWIYVFVLILSSVIGAGSASAQPFMNVGDQVHQITVPVSGAQNFCSIGLAFDGEFLYYDRCQDPNIYIIDPITGELQDFFNTRIAEFPNALAFDRTRNGIWIGAQSCNTDGMPISFWDFDDASVTLAFTIPYDLINPSTGQHFLQFCFTDGLAFDVNDPTNPNDDELWFSDDVNRNIGVFRTNGTFLRGYDATTIDPSLDTTSGIAIGGDFLYLANNGGGDIFRADKSTNPLELADQFTSGDSRQEDMECDPVTFAPTEVMWVRTTPQGGQFPDVITAYEIEAGSCGSGGAPPDTDRDGLYDVWEINGYDFDGDGNTDVDLPAMGANPKRKDIFVEIDWMDGTLHSHRPSENSINAIIDAFAIAPVPNPEGPQGITLHVDYGENTLGAFSEGNVIPHQDVLGTITGNNYDWTGFDQIKAANFLPERAPIFHYVVFAHSIGQLCGPSGVSRNTPASDFVVALGGWFRVPFTDVNDPGADKCRPLPLSGSDDQNSGTFMHELGHNLGLGHGGGDSVNNKPNYLSVMNYSFQMRGLIVNGEEGRFDYSGTTVGVPTLDETRLNEPLGLSGGGIPQGYGTRKFNCDQNSPQYIHVVDANGAIDWNCNGSIDTDPVQANINGDSFNGFFSNTEILQPWNDWGNVVFDGGLIGLGVAGEDLPTTTPIEEMTPEDAAQLQPLLLVLPVTIDIKPGSFPNSIKLRSTGTIPVAILSTTSFDAPSQVDKTSVSFGRTGNEQSLAHCNNTAKDVNGDGLLDQVCHFHSKLTGFKIGDLVGILKGKTVNGVSIAGQDSVRIVR